MNSGSSRSANSSAQRSKRILDNSSPSSPSSSGANKKKRIDQKTLGVAWGANSSSSSRSSRKSPFPDFGSYMVEKNRKLHNQFNVDASSASHSGTNSGNQIFQGVSIFVDGFTIPSSQELRGYMLKYGGRFENYFSRRSVSHIICSNLPDSKVKNLRSFSRGLPVVKPTWILDSVASNKLLSWVPYQLDQLVSNQPRLSAFFSMKKGPMLEKRKMCMTTEKNYETEDSMSLVAVNLKDSRSEVNELIESRAEMHSDSEMNLQDNADTKLNEKPSDDLEAGELKDTSISDVDESIEYVPQTCESFEMLPRNNADVEVKKEPSNEKCDHADEEPGIVDVGQSSEENISSLHGLSKSTHNDSTNNYYSDGSSSSLVAGSSKLRHSNFGKADFVESYFKKSRLHFIGTWRNRYYKRFPRSASGSNSVTSHISGSSHYQSTTIIHVDMDCFFVSVVIRNSPQFKDKPVAVCHSDNPKGTAEISSANYPARGYGVRAGMFVRDAKALCPQLVIFPYDFKSYEEVADQFYDILHKHCEKVQAVSCDEAFLDISGTDKVDPEVLASKIRKEIFDTTGCTASAGISTNMLMARLATRTAKPDGQCYIPSEKVDDYLDPLPIKDLPGIGRALEEKLKKRSVFTCGQLRMISKDSLQKDFGLKTGEMLWNYSRGVDNRAVGLIQESKSIGAEVNWGVRFKDFKDCQCFLSNLCKEVSLRLHGCGVQGRTFTLKIKKRRKDADEPTKYMGCGDCENLSHSLTVPDATDDLEILQRIAKQLFGFFVIDVKEIRGIGLQVSKLQNVDISKQGIKRNSLDAWLHSSGTTNVENSTGPLVKERANIDSEKQCDSGALDQLSADPTSHLIQMENNHLHCESLNPVTAPPLCNLDIGVIGSLPPELFSELNEIYGGKLDDLLAKSRYKSEACSSSLRVSSQGPGEGDRLTLSDVQENKTQLENKHIVERSPPAQISGEGLCNVVTPIPTSGSHRIDLLPSSLSQVDPSVLQELPEPLRDDILKQLPAHRGKELSLEHSVKIHHESCDATASTSGSIDSFTENGLWSGNPPLWVDKFKASNCLILQFLAETYTELGSPGNLYGILLRTLSKSWHPSVPESDGWDGAIYGLCELLKEYFKLKIELDIEETYACFHLLKRLAMKSQVFLEVFNIIDPYLQGAVNEFYGGSLKV
ncbi:DNA repair protein REV1 [Cucurbita moschata]|uniref:DNA repair protein REV1 n=1 Tax=Cucurbita moschata TaxID=3662 RepID=A0A6J1GLB6_CUCMO|nr:DNA repair protein REV1 [Cucurbita moschata]